MDSNEVPSTPWQGVSQDEPPCEPLDLRVVKNGDNEECRLCPPSPQRKRSIFFDALHLKNVSRPVAEVKPFSWTAPVPEDLSSMSSAQLSAPSQSMSVTGIVAADSGIPAPVEESRSKAALKFCLKKCGEFSLYFRSSSKKIVAPSNCRFRSLLTSLKNTVKSLAKSVPSTNVISRIHNSVIDKIKEKRMQDCLRFSLSFIPFNKRKKIKGTGSAEPVPLAAGTKPSETTFVNPVKKPELAHMAGFPFAKPKFYVCSYCDSRFYKLPIYIKHIRRHAEIIRCDICCKAFSSVINKRRHQLQCRQRVARSVRRPSSLLTSSNLN
ncbi:uncharacterized protein LOC131664076 [Phymastichus coffea]|uniref:uncharacterized protein LOC131664076 n=1 Tax=Phymastichus coffea TaxID=108790 RepID=UPI00273CB54E|nr:uncharacterized protein LOC131664076 [Phymastichus coffea]XP_058790924.1 uncharacterized protein LOC131664076 [Phymastichus coffea]XP_058790925.1 uncharacterized protein LOC131664076 [Phymastichus coffea]